MILSVSIHSFSSQIANFGTNLNFSDTCVTRLKTCLPTKM